MSQLISKVEWVGLTGAKQKRKQCEVLNRQGVKYTTDYHGHPTLSWTAYNMQIAGGSTASETQANDGPRFEAI